MLQGLRVLNGFVQAQRHAPGLKVTVYDGLAKKAADKDADDSTGTKKKKRRSFKKMSREERFKPSAVRTLTQHLVLQMMPRAFSTAECGC